MDYSIVRVVHISCASISIALFAWRAALGMAAVDWRRWKWLRVMPHLNDSILLGAAITLAYQSGQAPWTHVWLGAKVVALVAYVGLGRLALRPTQTLAAKALYATLALLTVGYIVGVALTRSAHLGLM